MKYVVEEDRTRFRMFVASTALVLGVVLVSLVEHAGATIDGALLRLGSNALAYPGTTPSTAHPIRINGVDVSYRVDTILAPLSEVWAHYSDTCGAQTTSSRPLAPFFRALAARGAVTDSQAYVACLDLARDDLASIVQLAGRAANKWDLSVLGPLRYVYARKDTTNPSQTLVFTMWVDGPLSLRSFVVPQHLDVPGTDLEHVPRPETSRRVLSVRQPSRALVVYRVSRSDPDTLARWYVERLRDQAWHVVTKSGRDWVSIDQSRLVFAENGTSSTSIIASATADGSAFVIAIESEAL